MSRERGSSTVEMVLLAPVLAVILGFVSAAGRWGATATAVRSSTDAAARRASTVARERMRFVAEQHVWERLERDEERCSRLVTSVMFQDQSAPRYVQVTVQCTIRSDGVLAFLTRGRTISATSREVIDVFTYR